MFSSHRNSSSANTYLVRSHDTEVPYRVNETGPENDYSKYHSLRHDKRYRRRKNKCKVPPHSKTPRTESVSYGKHFPSVRSNAMVSDFNRELLKDSEFDLQFDEKMKTLDDNNNWPALKLATENKKPDQKKQKPSQFLNVALQTEKYNHEVKYPLWNTREIALPVEDAIPILKQNKVSRGTQVENFMFIKHESPCKHELADKTLISATLAQNYKTYADAVQYEAVKLNQEFRQLHPVTATEMKTKFKIKHIRRNKITESLELKDFSSLKMYSGNSGTKKQSYLKDYIMEIDTGKGNKKRDMFCFEELVQSLIETRDTTVMKTKEEVTFGCKEINTKDKCPYQWIGDDDLMLKCANKFDFVENEGPFNKEYPNSLFGLSCLPFSKQFDPYYSFDQVNTRAKAEIIATEGFDLKTAFDIAHYLWQTKKQRLPYTRMFTESSAPSSNYDVEAHLEPCPQIQVPFPSLTQRRYHYLPDYDVNRNFVPIVYEPVRRVNGRYLGEMQVKDIHHQHVSPSMELPEGLFYSNSWRYPHARTENNGFVLPQRK